MKITLITTLISNVYSGCEKLNSACYFNAEDFCGYDGGCYCALTQEFATCYSQCDIDSYINTQRSSWSSMCGTTRTTGGFGPPRVIGGSFGLMPSSSPQLGQFVGNNGGVGGIPQNIGINPLAQFPRGPATLDVTARNTFGGSYASSVIGRGNSAKSLFSLSIVGVGIVLALV